MYTDDSILTWGKYKFTAIKRIPASWLLSKHKNTSIHDKELVAWVAENIDRLKEREEQEQVNKTSKFIVPAPPVCDKYQYASEEEAKKHLSQIRKEGQKSENHTLPIRAYKCDKCPFYHLTSKP